MPLDEWPTALAVCPAAQLLAVGGASGTVKLVEYLPEPEEEEDKALERAAIAACDDVSDVLLRSSAGAELHCHNVRDLQFAGTTLYSASDDEVASSTSPTPTPPSDSPRAVGTQKRFPCPAGCDRFFTHAPAAVQHGKTCAAKQKAAREKAFAHEASPPPPFTSPPETPLADAEARVLSLAEGPPPPPRQCLL